MSTHELTQQELREEIDRTRRELAETVEQLAARTAVKARLHDRVEHVKDDFGHPVLAAAIPVAAIMLFIGWTLSRRRG